MGNLYKSKITNENFVNLYKLYLPITVGAAGAVSAIDGNLIESVVKESTDGQYTITLQESYEKLVGANVSVLGTLGDYSAMILSEDVDGATPTVVVQIHTAGTEANVASGDKILVELIVKETDE